MATSTVVITSVTLLQDLVTATGTVDGTPTTVSCWQSFLVTMPTALAKQQYIAGLMKAMVYPTQPTTLPLTGTLTV